MIKEVNAKSGLYKLKQDRFPYEYDLNIYKGCGHGCRYCYARCKYSDYYPDSDFQRDIFVKKNIANILDIELSKKDYSNTFINLGGVCDSYQPIEKKYCITREVLKVMIKYRQPTLFSTKSSLVTRDIDLISQLSKVTRVVVGMCITSSDYEMSKILEPGASKPMDRYLAMKELKERTNAVVGLHIFPIIPYITDIGLEKIFEWGKDANVDYVLTANMHLRGKIRSNVLPYIHKYFPDIYPKYLEVYKGNTVSEEYSKYISIRLKQLRNKYGLNRYYPKFNLKSNKENLRLF